MTTRRQLLGAAAGLAALAAPSVTRAASGRIVIVGGGFGGGAAARQLKHLDAALDVTLVEPSSRFVTCPFSNLVLGGLRDIASISHGFSDLERLGVRLVRASAQDVDSGARRVVLGDGTALAYDRLVLSPGIDLRWNALEGYDEAAALIAPHAWKAGEQTLLLRRQLEAMEDGGVVVMTVPDNPYRCPPGPYERAGMIAHHLKTHRPRSKLLILDAKDTFSKKPLFQEGWKALYGDMVEWVGRDDDGVVVRIDAGRREAVTAFGSVHKAAVLNVIPPQRAGLVAERAGVCDQTGWVPVNPSNFASRQVAHIHVVGDATQAAPMPKSGFCAYAQGKLAAAAIVAELGGRPLPRPSWINTCYSLVGPEYGISVADVYRVADGRIATVPGSGGVSPLGASPGFRAAEAQYATGWYEAITQDIWGARG